MPVLRRPNGFVPMLTVLAFGVLVVHVVAAAAVLNTIARGDGVGDWVSFYAAGTMVRSGDAARLYDFTAQTAAQRASATRLPTPLTLPAFVALGLSPLTRLSFSASYWLWSAANLALLVGLLRAAWRHLDGVRREARLACVACLAVSTPVVTTLLLGQIDLLVVASIVGCYALMRRDRPFTAGAVLAVALAKPHIVAAILLLLLVKRQWRALAGVAAVGVPLAVIPVLLIGPHILLDQVALISSYPGSSTEHSVSAAMMVNVRGAIVSITGSSSPLIWAPPLAVIAGVAMWFAIRAWKVNPALDAQSWALALSLPLLYSPHLHIQTLVLLAGSGVLVVRAASDTDVPIRTEWVLLAYIAVGALWMLSIAGIALMFVPVLAAFQLLALGWPRAESLSGASAEPDQLRLAS